jgi:hypothetical protein
LAAKQGWQMNRKEAKGAKANYCFEAFVSLRLKKRVKKVKKMAA